jgi:hypothetical protein
MHLPYLFFYPISKAFACLLVLLLISSHTAILNAKVIYTEADTTLKAKNYGDRVEFEVDMNRDGVTDYIMSHADQGVDWIIGEIFSAAFRYGNEILVNGLYPAALDKDTLISSSLSEWKDTFDGGFGQTAIYIRGAWPGSSDKYFAVRFKVNTQTYYGWIKASMPEDESSVTIKGFAYENVAGQPIKAGDISTGISEYKPENDISVFVDGRDIVVRFSGNFEPCASITLYSVTGCLLKNLNVDNKSNLIDMSAFSPGVYFLKIVTPQGVVTKHILLI